MNEINYLKLKYLKNILLAFMATIPFFFNLQINSYSDICEFMNITADKTLLSKIGYKIQLLIGDFLMSFNNHNSVLFLFIFIFFIIIIKKYYLYRETRLLKCSLVPSLLFSFFEVFGKSFYETDSWNLIFYNYRTVLKSIFLFCGYTILFTILICLLFSFLKRTDFTSNNKVKENEWFTNNKKSFLLVMIIILAFWLPSLIANFPGITNYDFFDMINSFYGKETYSLKAVTLIDPSVTINNNNPVLQTLMAVGALKIGSFFGAPWIGLALFCYSQAFIFAAVLSYVIYFLAKIGVNKNIRIFLIILFGVLPSNANYAVTTLKDINFSFVFILYIICIIELIRNPKSFFFNKKKIIYFAFLNLLLMLLRNNGSYILIPTDICLLLVYRKYWKKVFISMIIPAFIFVVLISNVLYPYLKIAPGSKREMYSVPFQQTARLVKEHGDEIPQEDIEIIDKILDYDKIADRYEPELSDKVKATFRKESTSDEMRDYLNVWAKWLLKYPGVYIQATMSNCYGYFYPEAKSWISYKEITPPGKEYGLESPECLTEMRTYVNSIPETVREIPIFGLMESIGFYTWLLILSISYLIYINKNQLIVVYTPLLVLLLTCILSPANTMMRYVYPIILIVPILIAIILHIQKEG